MRLLITGSNGQLGRCLQDRLVDSTEFEFLAYSSKKLNVSDARQVTRSIAEYSPDAVINAAAYTAVDIAEDDVDAAFAVNDIGVKHLAQACAEVSIPLVHVSTDYVFDGKASQPYSPSACTSPIGVYGQSKLAGEHSAKQALNKLVILRTAWVYSEYGNNFVKTMLRLAESRDELGIVADQVGCPTYAGNIALAILNICGAIKSGAGCWGDYHYVDNAVMSWYEFAEKVFSVAKSTGILNKNMALNALSSDEYPTRAVRPAYSVLDTETLRQDYAIEQADMIESLRYVVARLASV